MPGWTRSPAPPRPTAARCTSSSTALGTGRNTTRTRPGIIAALRKNTADITDADVKIIAPPPVRGIGTAGGFKLIVEDQKGAGPVALGEGHPGPGRRRPGHSRHQPVIHSLQHQDPSHPRRDIDREKAETLGVSDSQVFNALQTYLGSTFVNDFNYLLVAPSRSWPRPTRPSVRTRPQSSNCAPVSSSGQMVPLGSLIQIQKQTGPYRVLRYNLYPAAEIQGDVVPGYSSGQAIALMQKLAKETLPEGFGYEFTELAYQQQQAGNTGNPCLRFVGGVRLPGAGGALRERDSAPIGDPDRPHVPSAAILGVNLRGQDNNILTQVGLGGADRSGGQERHPDRGVRPPGRA